MSNDDFVVAAHALDRFQERFPHLWTDDQEAAQLIHAECESALTEGRTSFVAPIELSTYDPDRWEAGKGLVAWVPDKTRGYVLLEDTDGLLVVTVLGGRPPDEARHGFYKDVKRRKEN